MTTEQIREIHKLRMDGHDIYEIARILNLTVPEVEGIVYGTKDNDTDTLLFWAGQHH